jgi:hypothetical protein
MFRVYIHLHAEVGGEGEGGDNSSNLLVKDTQQPTNHSFAPGFSWTDSNTGMGSLLTVLKPQKLYRAFLEGGPFKAGSEKFLVFYFLDWSGTIEPDLDK